MDSAPAPARLGALDGLRGLAALGIVCLHVWLFSTLASERHTPIGRVADDLRLGVTLFFVLSGFLLYSPWVRAALAGGGRPRLRSYALRRACRILPLYWVAVIVSVAVLAGTASKRMPDLDQLPVFFALSQNYFASTANMLNVPMWTLGIEASFYLALPLIGWAALKLGDHLWAQLGLLGVLAGAGVIYDLAVNAAGWPVHAYMTLIAHLPSFCAGMAVAVGIARRPLDEIWSRRLFWTGAALFAVVVGLHASDHPIGGVKVVRDIPAAVGFALMVGGCSGPARRPLLTCWPVRWLGKLSYSMYLLHMPVIYLLTLHLDLWPKQQFGWALLLVLAITVPLSVLCWKALESPMIEWARRKTPREVPALTGVDRT